MSTRLAMLWVILVGSVIVGVGRWTVPGHDLTGWPGLYETLAHVWVGVLITLGCLRGPGVRLESWVALGVITALEAFKFLMR